MMMKKDNDIRLKTHETLWHVPVEKQGKDQQMMEMGHDQQLMLDEAARLNNVQFEAYQVSEEGKRDIHAYNAKMGHDGGTCEYTQKHG